MDALQAALNDSRAKADAAALQQAELTAQMQQGVRVAFGSKDAVEAAKDLFDHIETL